MVMFPKVETFKRKAIIHQFGEGVSMNRFLMPSLEHEEAPEEGVMVLPS
jgi:hypothetical protein